MNKILITLILGFLLIFIVTIIDVTAQEGQEACSMCKLTRSILERLISIDTTSENINNNLSIISTSLTSIDNEIHLLHNNQGDIVTDTALLVNVDTSGTRSAVWMDMPVGTCDVTVSGFFGQINQNLISMEAANVNNVRNSQGCPTGSSESRFECTLNMSFDENFHFYRAIPFADSPIRYLVLAYKCVLA